MNNPNIRALATAAGWTTERPLIVSITAPLVGSLNLPAVAFDAGITINISSATRIGGAPAGPAFVVRAVVTVNNAGVISGGGGQGGHGPSVTSFRVVNKYNTNSASGGNGGTGAGIVGTAIQNPANGSVGTRQHVTDTVTGISGWAEGGRGGNGGPWGEAGVSAGAYSSSGTATVMGTYQPPNSREPGAAVDGNSYVTWTALGSIVGSRIN